MSTATLWPAWYAQALCAQTDPDVFYPEMGSNPRQAKRICERCEVKDECLAHALENGERHGVWGGTSEHERKLMLRDRRAGQS